MVILLLTGCLLVKVSGVHKDNEYKKTTIFFAGDTNRQAEDMQELKYRILDLYYQRTGEDKEEVLSHVYDTCMGITRMEFERKYAYYESEVYVVGENYFSFHTPEFLYGGGFLTQTDNSGKIIISESLAFRIFGSSNVCGQVLMCQGKALIISGVVRDDDSFLDKMSGADKELAYLPYDSVVDSVRKTKITAYEIVVREVLEGFSKGILMEALDADIYNEEAELKEKGLEYIDESKRFGIEAFFLRGERIKDYLIKNSPFVYPRWENRIRVTEYLLFLVSLLATADVVAIVCCKSGK